MALRLRQSSASRVRLISTMIAVFALIIQPMYAAIDVRVANASALSHSVDVRTEQELIDAAANKIITVIHIRDDIKLTNKIVLAGRDVNVKGHNNKLSFSGTDKWDGEYVIQAYKNLVTLGSLAISGGDAAVYANGATLRILGTVDVSNNKFGGIEVSQGDGVGRAAILNTAEGTLVNSTEINTKPTAWIDEASKVNATVNGNFTETTHIGKNQKQYYLSAEAADIAATNSTRSKTYASLQEAFDDANAEETVKLNKDVVIQPGAKAVTLDTRVVFDGGNKKISTLGVKGSSGTNANAGLIVRASGATVKNLTVSGTASTNGDKSSHGLIVNNATGVTLENITAVDNTVGVQIINGSNAAINVITTAGNVWGGVEVGKSTLSIKGQNSHNDLNGAPGVYTNNRSEATITDLVGQYVKTTIAEKPSDDHYRIDVDAPVTGITDVVQVNKYRVEFSGFVDDQNFEHYYCWLTDATGREVKPTRDANCVTTWASDLQRNGNPATALETGTGTSNAPVTLGGFDISDIETGNYNVNLVAVDRAKNKSVVVSSPISIDRTAPEVQLYDVADGGLYKGSVEVMATIEDENFSHYYLLVKTRKSGETKWTEELYEEKIYRHQITTKESLFTIPSTVHGDVIVRLETSDKYGNKSPVKIIEFAVDNRAPLVGFTAYDVDAAMLSGTSDSDEVFVTVRDINGVDLYTDLRVDVVNGVWGQIVDAPFTPGTYTVIVRAVDTAGNASTTTVNGSDLTFTVPVVVTVGGEISVNRPTPIEDLMSPFRTSFAVTPALIQPTVEAETDVLGAQDEKTQTSPIATVAAIEPSAQGWKFFGFAWFWWLLAAAAITAIWWWIAAARRRSQEA